MIVWLCGATDAEGEGVGEAGFTGTGTTTDEGASGCL